MGLLGTMSVAFQGNTSGLVNAVSSAKSILGSFASTPVGGVAVGLAAVGIAATTVASKAIQMAADFQTATTTLVTGAGESQKNLDMVRQGMLDLAVSTGTSTQQLVAGMFMIESAGYHGAGGLNVLKIAAQGAKVGNADLGTVANALTTILHDYHMNASQAADAMNGLTATVQNGKTNLQSLAGSMGSVLPLASALHISFPQVAGAIAEMTNSGMNAQRASMNLANAIRSLAAPGSSAQKAMKEVGISTSQLNDVLTHQGLQQALQLISDQVGKKFPAGSSQWTAAMKAIMGGATGLNVALMLGGKNMSDYKGNINAITDAMKNGHGQVTGWAAVQGTFNQKMAEAKQVVDTFLIKLGTNLLPLVTRIVGGFVDWETKTHGLEKAMSTIGTVLSNVGNFVVKVATGIGNLVGWFQKNQVAAAALLVPLGMLSAILVQMAVEAIVAFIASVPAMVAGFLAWAGAAAAAAVATIAATWPILLIGAAVGAVVAIIILAVTHWGQITAWLKGVWQNFSSWFGNIMSNIGTFVHNTLNNIGNFFHNLWNNIVNAAKIALAILVVIIFGPFVAIGAIFVWLYNHNTYFKMLVDKIVQFIQGCVTWLRTTWSNIVNWIVEQWNILKIRAEIYWMYLYVTIQQKILQVKQFVSSVVSAIVSFFEDRWNTLVGNTKALWGLISDVFGSAWNTYISKPLSNLWNMITGWFNNAKTAFLNFGSDIMHAIATGIGQAAGVVGNAIHGAISNALSALGFHGIPGFASGVRNFSGGLAYVHSNELLYLPKGTDVYNSSETNAMMSGRAMPVSSASNGGTQEIYVMLDSNTLAHVTADRQARLVRLKTGRRAA